MYFHINDQSDVMYGCLTTPSAPLTGYIGVSSEFLYFFETSVCAGYSAGVTDTHMPRSRHSVPPCLTDRGDPPLISEDLSLIPNVKSVSRVAESTQLF